jgi:HAD superfamily hydrolase (TIGR01509 family)
VNTITTVIFDMDGVLVNSEPVHQRLEKEMYEELGLMLSYEEQQTFVGMSAMDSWNFVIKKYGLSHKPEELLLRGREKYLRVLLDTDEVKLMDGAGELIGRLEKDFHLLLASSATSVTINEVLRKFNLKDTFPLYIGGDMVTASKPNPEIFLKIAEQACVDPGECVVIEDARHGITAAKLAGMKTIGFQNHHSGTQDLNIADVVVDNLEEITIDMIRQLSLKNP